MSRFNREIDCLFSNAGDFVLDEERSDIADTKNLQYRSLIQKMVTQISSGSGDWRLQPDIGAGLASFSGQPNSARTGRLIQEAITNALVSPELLRPEEVRVEVWPATAQAIAILVIAQPIGSSERIVLTFTYDTMDNKIVPRNY